MLYLVTGLPGSMKTTFVLRWLGTDPAFVNRPIYTHGVNGLHVDAWTQIDAAGVRDWRALPHGSVLLVDEAQKLFPTRGMGSKPPEWIEALAEHRHFGYDFVLISQHPSFIDPFVRKLVGSYRHLIRVFGLERATIYQWEQVQDPDSTTDQKFSVRTVFRPEAADYARHDSATQHTHKKSLPWKKFLGLGAAAAVVLLAVFFVVRHVTHGAGVSDSLTSAGEAAPSESSPGAARAVKGGRMWDAARRSPRAGFHQHEESAPIYDELQVVKTQPRVSGCADFGVSLGGRPSCFCTNNQGAILENISVHACKALIRAGWFDETRPFVDWQERHIARLDKADAATTGKETGSERSGTAAAAPVSPVGKGPDSL